MELAFKYCFVLCLLVVAPSTDAVVNKDVTSENKMAPQHPLHHVTSNATQQRIQEDVNLATLKQSNGANVSSNSSTSNILLNSSLRNKSGDKYQENMIDHRQQYHPGSRKTDKNSMKTFETTSKKFFRQNHDHSKLLNLFIQKHEMVLKQVMKLDTDNSMSSADHRAHLTSHLNALHQVYTPKLSVTLKEKKITQNPSANIKLIVCKQQHSAWPSLCANMESKKRRNMFVNKQTPKTNKNQLFTPEFVSASQQEKTLIPSRNEAVPRIPEQPSTISPSSSESAEKLSGTKNGGHFVRKRGSSQGQSVYTASTSQPTLMERNIEVKICVNCDQDSVEPQASDIVAVTHTVESNKTSKEPDHASMFSINKIAYHIFSSELFSIGLAWCMLVTLISIDCFWGQKKSVLFIIYAGIVLLYIMIIFIALDVRNNNKNKNMPKLYNDGYIQEAAIQ